MSASSIDHGGSPRLTAVHPDIIHSHILSRLDGPTLAAAGCASAHLLHLCSDERLCRDICNSTWPSTTDPRVRAAISAFPSAHRSFYSDAFTAIRNQPAGERGYRPLHFMDTPELISAVDIHCDGKLIYSKVLVTETSSAWFLCTPLRLDLLDPKETLGTPLDPGGGASAARAADRLRVSWILIDPAGGRAFSCASRRAMVARRHWLTGDLQLRYSVVVAGGMAECALVVGCRTGDDGGVRVCEAIMQVESMDGRILAGMEGLEIIQAAMTEGRTNSDGGRERDVYAAFCRKKARCKDRKERRDKGLDTACIATGISVFAAFLIIFFMCW